MSALCWCGASASLRCGAAQARWRLAATIAAAQARCIRWRRLTACVGGWDVKQRHRSARRWLTYPCTCVSASRVHGVSMQPRSYPFIGLAI